LEKQNKDSVGGSGVISVVELGEIPVMVPNP